MPYAKGYGGKAPHWTVVLSEEKTKSYIKLLNTDLHNGRTFGEAESPVMWCCTNEPVTKFQTSGAKIDLPRKVKIPKNEVHNETLL
jgi:hypothetical protein